MRFKKCQKVVCVKREPWLCHYTNRLADWPCPEYNEIVTVEEYDGKDHFFAIEYPIGAFEDRIRASYLETHFAPLMDITELTEILEQQPEHA